ncbi:metallophosphoesterase family protein [Achromobacter xylosoxidans]
MSNFQVRLAFISDLHAYHPQRGVSGAGPSYLPANPGVADPDPFGDLDQLIDREKLCVDLLLCGGDICDQADLRGFQYAWQKMNALKERLSARELIATCGNHDLNSRLIESDEDPDPKGALQTVQPQFPFEDKNLTNHFWARNFAIVQPVPGVSIVVLNTSAYHGGADDEHRHGRVSQRTITAIEKELQGMGSTDLNILLCHHHVRPLQGLWTNAPDIEYMKKGGELLRALTMRTATPWLVLHGHRHVPNLEHSNDPSVIVVGASSFSRQVQGRFNQFHVLDVEVDDGAAQPLKGTIETWSWNRQGGWQKRPVNDDGEGFPPFCGFGSAFLPRAIVGKIRSFVGDSPDYVLWSSLVQHVPDLKFMTPTQFSQMETLLGKCNINLYRDREGNVTQVGTTKMTSMEGGK